MKNQKIKSSFKLIHFIIIIGGVLIFTSPLAHKLFSKKNNIVEIYKKELKHKEVSISNDLDKSRANYNKGIISAENYIIINDSLLNNLKNLKKENKKLINLKINSNRFFGWKTVRTFLIGLGVRLPFLFLAIILSFLIFKIDTKDKYLKRSLFFLQISCYGISFYYMFWVFWTSQDYPVAAYRWFFILFSLSISSTIVYFIFYREVFKINLEIKLKNVIAFIFRTRNKHYPEIASKALYAEIHDRSLKNNKTIENSSNDFEDDLLETLEKVVD